MLENLDIKISKKKIAIVLFNLGGPNSLNSVKKFLFNLFYDRAIINLPNPLRFIIAKIISIIRNKKSQKIYSLIGNKSPILQETESQKDAITEKLKTTINDDFKIFIAMRHFYPNSKETVKRINEYNPSEIILLPLYPQFSSTTTGSSIKEFISSFQKNRYSNSNIPIKTICCYPMDDQFIKSHLSLIKRSLKKLKNKEIFRILFSAHGLPKKIIKAGDPYQWQIEKTVENLVSNLNIDNLDYKITYQSRVGPIEWLKPNTEDEIKVAGKESKSLIIVPIAFVSEHVETLVELDIEYRRIADEYQIEYIRTPALGINKLFINSLAKMVSNLVDYGEETKNLICSSINKKICPDNFTMCPCNLKN
ncbi:MAG: ferrochelatase [Rickettsia endosymbiont of Pseudomimeciton antennatum]|nr:ferrochelatase [Rickettsia endosymbiont of Pseudomimeciton antennatum]MCC8398511.1 ferrochelatase [Rickettsia endosymbiont of Labidopullus appendiculatus]